MALSGEKTKRKKNENQNMKKHNTVVNATKLKLYIDTTTYLLLTSLQS